MFASFKEAFKPEERFRNVRLSGNCPCNNCPNVIRYFRGTAIEEDYVDRNKCFSCIKMTKWQYDCMEKLAWYENNDSLVKDLPRTCSGIYSEGKLIDKKGY